MKRPLKPTRAILSTVAVLLLAIAAIWFGAGTLWDRSPKPPDIKAMDLRSAMTYEGSDDYLKLSLRHRQKFSEALAERIRELPFEELLRNALDPGNMELHRRRLANLKTLPNFDKLHSQYAADFLKKFYQLPEFKRTFYLTTFAFYQEIEVRLDPGRYQTPKPGDFHADAVKLFSSQPPVMKAYGMQFFIDLQHQRRRLGLPERSLPMK